MADSRRDPDETDVFLCIWVTVMSAIPDFILSNLMTFLTRGLGYSLTTSVALVNAYNGFMSIFGILGAIVIDAYLAHNRMIFISSLFYFYGLLIITIELYHLQNSESFPTTVRWMIGLGLFLIAIGKSTLRNSANVLFGDGRKPNNITQGIEYTIKCIFLLISIKRLHFFSEYAGSPKVFLAASILMFTVSAVSLCYMDSFVKRRRDRQYPLKSPFRVCTAVIMNRRLQVPVNSDDLYNKISDHHQLEHTDGIRFLDKAAVVEVVTEPEEGRKRWLCTVTEVEECKRLIRMFPICTTFFAYGIIRSIGDTLFLDQGNIMDNTVRNDTIPLQTFILLSQLISFGSKFFYKFLISARLEGPVRKYGPAIEYAMGMVLCTICCSVASWVIVEKLITFRRSSFVSVFWLAPQFILFGAMDGLVGQAIQEFFKGQLPPSIKAYDIVFSDGVTGAGGFVAIAIVSAIQAVGHWFSDYKYRLDRYYYLCTVLGIFLFFAHIYFAARYKYQEDKIKEGDEHEAEQERLQVPAVDSNQEIMEDVELDDRTTASPQSHWRPDNLTRFSDGNERPY